MIISIFNKYPLFPKIFPENFIDGINPPKSPVKVSYRGGYGRGDPHIGGLRGYATGA